MNEQEKTNVQDRIILLLSNGNFEHTETEIPCMVAPLYLLLLLFQWECL